MNNEHIVAEGECIASIAFDKGFLPNTLWEHPQNAALKQERKFGTVLKAGDSVFIPDKQIKEVTGGTEAEHLFVRKGIPESLRIQLLDEEDKPRAGLTYIVTIEGNLRRGKTDGDGFVTIFIPPNAMRGHLIVEENGHEEEYDLQLGYLEPVTEIKGVQSRLTNLGYPCGNESGNLDELTKRSILAFQEANNLSATGELNPETLSKLQALHGS